MNLMQKTQKNSPVDNYIQKPVRFYIKHKKDIIKSPIKTTACVLSFFFITLSIFVFKTLPFVNIFIAPLALFLEIFSLIITPVLLQGLFNNNSSLNFKTILSSLWNSTYDKTSMLFTQAKNIGSKFFFKDAKPSVIDELSDKTPEKLLNEDVFNSVKKLSKLQ